MKSNEEEKSIEEEKPNEEEKSIEEEKPDEEVKSIEEEKSDEEVKSIEEEKSNEEEKPVEKATEEKLEEEEKPAGPAIIGTIMSKSDPINETPESIDEQLKSEVGIADTQFDLPEKVTEIKPMTVPDIPATGIILPDQSEPDPILYANEEKQGDKEEAPIIMEELQSSQETPKEISQEILQEESKEEPPKDIAGETKQKKSIWICCNLRRKEEPPNSVMTPLLDPTNTAH